MEWHGRIEYGVVVVGGGAVLPEGRHVRIALLTSEPDDHSPSARGNLGLQLLELVGQAKGLPVDSANRHDDYLNATDSL